MRHLVEHFVEIANINPNYIRSFAQLKTLISNNIGIDFKNNYELVKYMTISITKFVVNQGEDYFSNDENIFDDFQAFCRINTQ